MSTESHEVNTRNEAPMFRDGDGDQMGDPACRLAGPPGRSGRSAGRSPRAPPILPGRAGSTGGPSKWCECPMQRLASSADDKEEVCTRVRVSWRDRVEKGCAEWNARQHVRPLVAV